MHRQLQTGTPLLHEWTCCSLLKLGLLFMVWFVHFYILGNMQILIVSQSHFCAITLQSIKLICFKNNIICCLSHYFAEKWQEASLSLLPRNQKYWTNDGRDKHTGCHRILLLSKMCGPESSISQSDR